MRILFVGTSELGIPSLKALNEHGGHTVIVATKPDQIGGRGKKMICSPVKLAANELGVECKESNNANSPEMISLVKDNDLQIIVVASFWAKLGSQLLDAAPLGGINIHPSLLPRFRGAAPIQHALLNGDPVSGVTIFQMMNRMDAGMILARVEEKVDPIDNYATLHDRLSLIAAPLLLKLLDDLEAGSVSPVAQDESKVVPAPMFSKKDGLIDWSKNADQIERLIRATFPWPGAFTFLKKGKKRHRLSILKSTVFTGQDTIGSIEEGALAIIDDRLMVACGQGYLEIEELKREGKKRMSAKEFLRGCTLQAGSRFEGNSQ